MRAKNFSRRVIFFFIYKLGLRKTRLTGRALYLQNHISAVGIKSNTNGLNQHFPSNLIMIMESERTPKFAECPSEEETLLTRPTASACSATSRHKCILPGCTLMASSFVTG